MGYIVQLFTIPGKEYCSCPRAVSNANNVTLVIGRTIRSSMEGLIVPPLAPGSICN